MISFSRPSRRRVLWSFVAVTLACCVLAGIAVYVGFIANKGPDPVPSSEYVQLAIMCLVFWGPMYLSIGWPITVPLIGALTALVAYAHRGIPDGASTTAPDPQSESGSH